MIISSEKNTVQGNVAKFKYLGMTSKNQNGILEEIKRRLNSGNDCYCLG